MKEESNKKYWERIAKLYAPLMEKDQKFYGSICQDIKPYLNAQMRVLELACGSGQLSFPLSEYVKEWTATDFSEAMIEEAKRRGETKNLHFSQADATALNYENESFDAVVIANALHIMPSPNKAMEEIRRVLKPNGILCAPTFLWHEGKVNLLRKHLMSLTGFKIYTEWDRQSFQKFIESYGFTVKQSTMINGELAPVCVLIAEKE